MPLTLRAISGSANSDTLYAFMQADMPNAAAIGANAANTTIQSTKVVPFNYKIRKAAIYVPSIDAVAGLDSFNLVVGTTGAYTQGNVAANDNSDTYGYPTNLAVAGNCVFGNDVPFNATNLQSANTTIITTAGSTAAGAPGNLTGQGVPGTGWIALATGGGYGIFVPTNYDAVYPQGVPLTLRCTTVASTGSIGAGLQVTLAILPIKLRYAEAGILNQNFPMPGVDY